MAAADHFLPNPNLSHDTNQHTLVSSYSTMNGDFQRVSPRVSFPKVEADILNLWDEIDAFAQSVALRPEENEYTFYDGPPFATGSPHYGHILAGVIKDIVPRYWTMRGYRVERRFGWDTHGLPVEMEVEKALGISGPRQISEFGVDKYNEACRTAVQTSAKDWEEITRRMGRWVDFKNDYKTLDTNFMESVWWVFKQLWDKGLIYKAFKVLPYSSGATTPLSNFEANLDYREIDNPSITVKLEIAEDFGPLLSDDSIAIWTTTPWTLPSNLAVAVGRAITYAAVSSDHGRIWVAEKRVESVFGDAEIIDRCLGEELIGASYLPPFDYFGKERDRGAFQIIASDEVSTEEGTGVVHIAPAYGESDFFAVADAGLNVLVDPIDAEARFTDEVPDVAGMYVRDADKVLMDMLAARGTLMKRDRIRHSYPFCWRTGTPLIYKAIPTWFVSVEMFKDRMVKHNQKIHWVPVHVGEKRFGNWLEGARDWAISRNRYWGSCMPVWECDTADHIVCIGSIEELFEYSGVRLDDLHKHFVDPITFACPECDGTMTRIPEVLDCWFESGSMPVAQKHYPFENEERFKTTFPAQFIAEGIDQTRGWFYTLVVLSTALFNEPPFENCVVNGHILAEDGRKMSKSLKNYPDPREVLSEFGADPLRAYLINSPVLRAEPLRFSKAGVKEVNRTVMIPLWNAYSFFTTYADADGIEISDLLSAPPIEERPELDRWILSVLQSLISEVNVQMESYYLYAVIAPTLAFISDLTNWYIRQSRRRFWRTRVDGDADKLAAFATLYEVLVTFSKVLAPILPFVTEELYQNLAVRHIEGPASVHHCDYPQADENLIDPGLEQNMATVRLIVSLGHALRKQHEVRVRQPLSVATILTKDPDVIEAVRSHSALICQELNVKTVVTSHDETNLIELSMKPNFQKLGPKLGRDVKKVAAAMVSLSENDVTRLAAGETISVEGHDITSDDVITQRTPREDVSVATEGRISVAIDLHLTSTLRTEGLARELVATIQGIRKNSDFAVTDRINILWCSKSADVRAVFTAYEQLLMEETLAVDITESDGEATAFDVAGKSLSLSVTRAPSTKR